MNQAVIEFMLEVVVAAVAAYLIVRSMYKPKE